jgi:hypothetical protein
MSSLTQFSDLSLSEEFSEVFTDDGQQGHPLALGRSALPHPQDKISPNTDSSQGKGNPNWKTMASLDVPPLRINRSISVEKSTNE